MVLTSGHFHITKGSVSGRINFVAGGIRAALWREVNSVAGVSSRRRQHRLSRAAILVLVYTGQWPHP